MKYALEQAGSPQIKRCATIGRERRDVNGRNAEALFAFAARRKTDAPGYR